MPQLHFLNTFHEIMVSQMLTLSTNASARDTPGKTFWTPAARWSPDTTRGAERRLGDSGRWSRVRGMNKSDVCDEVKEKKHD